MDIDRLLAPHVRELVPYQSARRIGGHGHTFLNANEAPRSDFYVFNSTQLNRYPDCQPQDVRAAYADYADVSPERVLISRGSDEAIGLIMRAFVVSGREGVIIAPPTYGMYEVAARTHNAAVVTAARDPGTLGLTARAVRDALAAAPCPVKAVFIDRPANPLGTLTERAEIETLLRDCPDLLVVVDEAYTEYAPAGSSCVPLLPDHERLIVLRTLSKAFALAGLRCGFTLAHPDVIAALQKVIDPYPVSSPVAQIAVQALAPGGIELMRRRVEDTIARRETLRAALRELPAVRAVFPGCGNFLLVRFADGATAFRAAAERGIILRSFADRPGLEDCLRLTVGAAEEMQELMQVLRGLPDARA